MAAFTGSLDANVLLRLLLNDIPDQHAAAARLLEAGSQLAVADTAVIEIAFVLERHYRLTRPQISEAVEGLISLIEINCNRSLFTKALPLFVKCRGLSFEDCCLATYAELNDATPLWTFDQRLANQAPSARLVSV
jgi:predicted nucleic-acid-binding protein